MGGMSERVVSVRVEGCCFPGGHRGPRPRSKAVSSGPQVRGEGGTEKGIWARGAVVGEHRALVKRREA